MKTKTMQSTKLHAKTVRVAQYFTQEKGYTLKESTPFKIVLTKGNTEFTIKTV